jgi:hypothetical protein
VKGEYITMASNTVIVMTKVRGTYVSKREAKLTQRYRWHAGIKYTLGAVAAFFLSWLSA